MAIAELIEKAKGSLTSADEPHYHDTDEPEMSFDIPDDVSGLEALEPDPKPKRIATRRTGSRTAQKITAAQRRQVTDNLEMLAGILCLGWSFRDDICPAVLSEHQSKIIDKMVPLIARSPSAMEWLVGKEANFLDWVAFAHAVAPVAKTWGRHHITHSIGNDHEEKEDHDHGGAYDYPAPVF